MSHVFIEHSDFPPDMDVLNARRQAAAIEQDAQPPGGLRVCTHHVKVARTGDGRERNGYTYISGRLGRGRYEATRRWIDQPLLAELGDIASGHFAEHTLSLDLRCGKLAGLIFKHNNIHDGYRSDI